MSAALDKAKATLAALLSGAVLHWRGIALALVAGFAVWTFWPRPQPVVDVAAPLPPAPEVRTIEKVRTEIKYVYVYPDKAKKPLGLPDKIAQDPAQKVIATGKLEAEERDYTLSAVLDTGSGQAEIHSRPDPLPWIGPGRGGKIGVAYGIKDGEPTGRLYASHDLIQVKALHAGGMATLDTDSDWFAGGYVEWRF